jgi:hypothetical protein
MQSGATIGGAVIDNDDHFGGCRTACSHRLKNLALLARQARDTILIWSGVYRMLAVAGLSMKISCPARADSPTKCQGAAWQFSGLLLPIVGGLCLAFPSRSETELQLLALNYGQFQDLPSGEYAGGTAR